MVIACDTSETNETPTVEIDGESLTVLSSATDRLWDVRDLVQLSTGAVWALSGSEPFVRRIDSVGDESFGRRGDGPGELTLPYSIMSAETEASVTVWDAGRNSALTFDTAGNLLSSVAGPNLGIVRSDIAEVTFGDPFRAARTAGSILVARYDSGVIHANDLWNGILLSIPLDGGDPDEVVSFRRDLPGAELRSDAVLLVSVPLWDACPDGRVAVLDPIARILFLISPADGHREAITLPWEPTKLDAGTRRSYMSARIAAEAARQLTSVELEQVTNEALSRGAELFASDEPLGVDIRCGTGDVWIQAFDRDGDFLGYGSGWLRVSLASEPGAIMRVRFPSGFKPHRFSTSHAIGVLSDPVGLQDVAIVALPPALTTARPPSTSVPNTTRRQGEPNT